MTEPIKIQKDNDQIVVHNTWIMDRVNPSVLLNSRRRGKKEDELEIEAYIENNWLYKKKYWQLKYTFEYDIRDWKNEKTAWLGKL